MNYAEALNHLRAVLRADDLRGAVMFLNSLTTHRYTSLFRFDGDTLDNVVFFDRENPEITRVDAMPVTASYCVFVRDFKGNLIVPDADADDRVGGHPKKPVFKSYCGVPLMDSSGRMFGTVCHFDPDAKPISRENIELMEALAPMLATSRPMRDEGDAAVARR